MKTLPAPTGLYDPFVHSMVDDPYPVYRRLRSEHPVYHNADHDFWALSRFDDVQRVARDWRTFSNSVGQIDTHAQFFGIGDFIDSDPPKHDRLRDVVKDVFAPKAVKELEHKVRDQVNVLLDPILDRGSGEFVSEVGSRLPLSIIFGLLGYPESDGEYLLPLLYESQRRVPGERGAPERAVDARRAVEDYIENAAEERRKRPREDLLSRIVAAESSRGVLPEEVTGTCMLLMIAGWETTSVTTTNAMWLLAHHPEQRRELTARPDMIPAAVEEMLRFESPVQQLSRITTAEVTLHDQIIPAGERVLLLWASANRDERRWEDSETFDPGREPQRNLAFGEGIHHCLGASLARLEARILVETILARQPEFEVGRPERYHQVVIRGIRKLPVIFN